MTQLTFNGLGISPRILESLDKLRFTVPTPIQHQSIPSAIQGKDVLGVAQTGTGKTLAFGIPVIQQIAKTKGTGVIILPTRELALQVNESLNKIGRFLGLKTVVLIGGESVNRQAAELRRGYHIVIATPGRLIDLLEQRKLHLNKTSVLVLDEADRMLDMGFEPQVKKILRNLPEKKQTMLFSATIPPKIMRIIPDYFTIVRKFGRIYSIIPIIDPANDYFT